MRDGWCSAVADERAALERARDARAGYLADVVKQQAFADALTRFTSALDAHVAATGCTLRH